MRKTMRIVVVLVVAFFVTTQVYAETIRFPDDNPYLQDAIDSLAPGDTVLVTPGQWVVYGVALRDSITVRSENGNPSTTILIASSRPYIFSATGVSGVVLHGLWLTQASDALRCSSAELLLSDMVFGDNSDRGIKCWSSELALHGVVFIGGTRGMFCENSELLLDGVVFRDNGRTGSGAGMFCSASNVTLTDCTFESNEVGVLEYTQTTWSYRGSGGGAYLTDASTLAASDVTFDSNHTWYQGAGLCLRGEGTSAELTGCVFTNNTTSTDVGYMGAEQRGAALSVTDGAEVVLDDVTFARNWSNGGGGAISCTEGGHAAVSGCVFTECEATTNGGAILAFWGADVTATGCLFRRNLAGGRGGAVYTYTNEGVPVELSYCIFDGNLADGGGAVFAFRGHVGLAHCTLVENEAGRGSSVRAHPWGTAAVANCILSYGAGGHVVSGDVEVTHCCVLEPEPGSGLCGEPYENICADPLFCPSPARDFSLCANSPCLPSNNEWSELIGAVGEGCGSCNPLIVEMSWGSIKAMFRGD